MTILHLYYHQHHPLGHQLEELKQVREHRIGTRETKKNTSVGLPLSLSMQSSLTLIDPKHKKKASREYPSKRGNALTLIIIRWDRCTESHQRVGCSLLMPNYLLLLLLPIIRADWLTAQEALLPTPGHLLTRLSLKNSTRWSKRKWKSLNCLRPTSFLPSLWGKVQTGTIAPTLSPQSSMIRLASREIGMLTATSARSTQPGIHSRK